MSQEKFISAIQKYLSEQDVRRVQRAIEMAREKFGDGLTPWGIPYIENYSTSAQILLELKPDAETLCACFLQKTPFFDDQVLHEIEIEFGESVRKLVDNLHQIIKFNEKNESPLLVAPEEYVQEMSIDALRRMFLAMATDLRVIIIRLAEKLNRLQHLHFLDKEVRKAYAQETLDIFVPIADRLGIFQFKRKLEDLCFKHLEKKNFEDIKNQFDRSNEKHKKDMEFMKLAIKDFLKEHNIEVEVEGRIKGYYSTFKKIQKRDFSSINKVLDLFALRVIVENQEDCYRVLGLIHNKWQLLPGRFKDYIAAPKVNGYRSLHTTIVGLAEENRSKPVEIQIRTKEMHTEAQFGIAAHWWYKEKETDKRTFAGNLSKEQTQYSKNYEEKIQWVKNLVDLHENLKSNNQEYSQSVKLNLFSDRIFVVTPHGDVIDLPKGATIVDFAYAVHSDIGNHCVRAKVDGENVSLDYELKNSNTVEVHTDPKRTPNRYWLSFIKTQKAREKIHAWIKSLKQEDVIREGKKIINKHLKNLGEPELDSENLIFRNIEGERLTVKEREKIIEDIAREKVSALSILKKLFPEHQFFQKRPESLKWKGGMASRKIAEPDVLVTGQKGYETRLASCCKPKPGDSIIGYITRGGYVTVHKLSCNVLKNYNKTRLINVSWEGQKQNGIRTTISLHIEDQKNILFEITKTIKEAQIEILDFGKELENEKNILNIKVEVVDYEHLDLLINKIENVDGVEKVYNASLITA